jgi:hypothetical protein
MKFHLLSFGQLVLLILLLNMTRESEEMKIKLIRCVGKNNIPKLCVNILLPSSPRLFSLRRQ